MQCLNKQVCLRRDFNSLLWLFRLNNGLQLTDFQAVLHQILGYFWLPIFLVNFAGLVKCLCCFLILIHELQQSRFHSVELRQLIAKGLTKFLYNVDRLVLK